MALAQRLLGAVDLAIEFATLGEYGLERLPEAPPCRQRSGLVAGREAQAVVRTRGCGAGAFEPRHPQACGTSFSSA